MTSKASSYDLYDFQEGVTKTLLQRVTMTFNVENNKLSNRNNYDYLKRAFQMITTMTFLNGSSNDFLKGVITTIFNKRDCDF